MATEFGPPAPPGEERQMLQNQVAFLKSQLEAIKKRIEELEQKPKEKS
jgi:hypothetical protein